MSTPEETSPLEFLDRLASRGVEYTYVKQIVSGAPTHPIFTILAYAPTTPMGKLFRDRSYGEILETIAEEEERLSGLSLVGDSAKRSGLHQLEALKHDVYECLIREPRLTELGRRLTREVISRGRHKSGGAKLSERHIATVVIRMWKLSCAAQEKPELLGERRIPAEKYDPNAWTRAVGELLSAYSPWEELMKLRFRSTLRSRRDPEGWPVVTRYIVPGLYDYLKPFYPVRKYTHGLEPGNRGPGAFPLALMKDITDILRFELPSLCQGLTWRRVLAAVRRYLQHADLKRPMGEEIFKLSTRRGRKKFRSQQKGG